jgi:hypothetical protein
LFSHHVNGTLQLFRFFLIKLIVFTSSYPIQRSKMAAKYTLLATIVLTTMLSVYGLQCYAGASLGSIDAATVLTVCTECGSQSFTIFGVTTKTYSCYVSGQTCTSSCCSTDLCNSSTNISPWIIGSSLIMLMSYVLV